MKKNALFVFVTLTGLLALSACSAKIESVDPDGVIRIPLGDGQSVHPSNGKKTELEGKWFLGCASLGGQLSISGELAFQGDSFEQDMRSYGDAGCTQLLDSSAKKGTFTLPGVGQVNFSANDGESAFDIYLIEGDALYFGEQAGESEAARPAAISRKLAWKRSR